MTTAFCAAGGKIVVSTELLTHFKADAEVATIIAHEVGHDVARHSAEHISKNLWLIILKLILNQFCARDVVNPMSNLFIRHPFFRRMEMEADYIGLLLLASASYDPRVAPQVYEKLGQVGGQSALQGYHGTHPSGNKRAQVLSQAKVMEEAIYCIEKDRWIEELRIFISVRPKALSVTTIACFIIKLNWIFPF